MRRYRRSRSAAQLQGRGLRANHRRRLRCDPQQGIAARPRLRHDVSTDMSTHYDVQALPAEQREHILRGFGLGWWRQLGQVAIVFGVVLLACWYVGLLDATTLLNGLPRSEEHTSELQSLMRISYAVFCLKKKKN